MKANDQKDGPRSNGGTEAERSLWMTIRCAQFLRDRGWPLPIDELKEAIWDEHRWRTGPPEPDAKPGPETAPQENSQTDP